MNALNISHFFEDLADNAPAVLAVPIALVGAVFKVVAILLQIATFPLRVAQFIVRRITRQSLVSYFLYVFVPYCLSIVYTIFGIIFPQVHTVSRVIQVLLHPIRWILGIAEQVDRRAGPIREVVEVLSPRDRGEVISPRDRRRNQPESVRRRISTSSVLSNAEKANDERIQCCICLFREKSVLLRPCNHLCLCDVCFNAVMSEGPPLCPVCRTTIESHISVFM
ncbi:unnamed protein product [Nippostrongylus brasiliensis]|uniref:RING-type domain-containing protein n=1 Tax=Nippostrongylus brasiliensis TaxID=27835 RepID=A0A0N4YNH1_NIPBR|nr:unnamed protein product [Nippostrongylus brasiliensis]